MPFWGHAAQDNDKKIQNGHLHCNNLKKESVQVPIMTLFHVILRCISSKLIWKDFLRTRIMLEWKPWELIKLSTKVSSRSWLFLLSDSTVRLRETGELPEFFTELLNISHRLDSKWIQTGEKCKEKIVSRLLGFIGKSPDLTIAPFLTDSRWHSPILENIYLLPLQPFLR